MTDNAYHVIVVGGGPAGMLCSAAAATGGNKVLLLEKNSILGKKLLITGKGRCNITNTADLQEFLNNISSNRNFLYSALNAFDYNDIIGLLARYGVKTKTERGNRVFPLSDRSADVANALKRHCLENGVEILHKEARALVIDDNIVKGVILKDNSRIYSKAVVIATGGVSYPQTGSTGDGYAFARQAGHIVIPPKASLVPLNVKEREILKLQGLSLRNAGVRACDKQTGKTVYEDFGELLFTHFGVSGPTILSLSAHIEDNREYTLSIDLKPALDYDRLDSRVLRDFEKYSNRELKNALNDLLPQKLIDVFIGLTGISPEQRVNVITREQRKAITGLLKNFSMTVTGKRPVSEAIITRGGVSTKEINPSTMESKLLKGLYFAGEVIDVDGYTGGFNLQIAFSTGYLAGISL